MKEFTLEELSSYDGKEGKPAYVVHRGMVYDVSGSRLWKGGLHMNRHHAGTDLSTDIGGAPHGPETLERVPQVGTVKKEEAAEERRLPSFLASLIERFPMLRRHPHPHDRPLSHSFHAFGRGLQTAFYVATGVKSLENTAFHCLTAGFLFTPVVMLTGLFSWWLNYLARPVKPIVVKLSTSLALFLLSLLAFTWRAAEPGIMDSLSLSSAVYFLLVLSLAPMVMVIGWFGAGLTFPVEKG